MPASLEEPRFLPVDWDIRLLLGPRDGADRVELPEADGDDVLVPLGEESRELADCPR